MVDKDLVGLKGLREQVDPAVRSGHNSPGKKSYVLCVFSSESCRTMFYHNNIDELISYSR